LPRHRGISSKKVRQLLVDDGGHDALHLAVAQLGLGLPLELRVRDLDADHRGQALADVVARHRLAVVLDELVGLAVLVHVRVSAERKPLRWVPPSMV
jgi:hypothetical protein